MKNLKYKKRGKNVEASSMYGALFAEKVPESDLEKLGLEGKEIYAVKFKSAFPAVGKIFYAFLLKHYEKGKYTQKFEKLQAKLTFLYTHIKTEEDAAKKERLIEKSKELEKQVFKLGLLQNREFPKIKAVNTRFRVIKKFESVCYCEKLK